VTTQAQIAVERRGATVVARLGGEVDMTNAAHVRDELLASVPNDALALVIDLGGCRYLDSAAIEVVFDVSRRLGRRRQQLRLVVPDSSPLTRVLRLTDVTSVAAVHDTLDSALDASQ
jgi:anti-sigma B factor antagonist